MKRTIHNGLWCVSRTYKYTPLSPLAGRCLRNWAIIDVMAQKMSAGGSGQVAGLSGSGGLGKETIEPLPLNRPFPAHRGLPELPGDLREPAQEICASGALSQVT